MTTKTRSDSTLRSMQAIIDFIRAYHKVNGFAPTLKEITVGIGKPVERFGNVQPLIKQLVEEGFLVSAKKGSGRSLAVSKSPPRKKYYEGGE